ncbi:unnamed protein product [Allacma fusca]|uniref:GP-PDE domain-containing protein n=1 Tax=Allacma fusca TaxID=39272 RepID=A0A8J2JIH2_9HEXA|nr:unnamed protein product [Allacma fusca]
MAGVVNMEELGALLQMGMRILPAPLSSPAGGSIVTTFISCSRFWMMFYAFWLLFMDMFFTIFPTTLIFISILTLILHYTRIPTPPNQFVHAVFGMDPNIAMNNPAADDNRKSWTSASTIARQLANQVMDSAINYGQSSTNPTVIAGLSALKNTSVGKSSGKDGFTTPTPDLILEQGLISSKNEAPLPVIGHRGAGADVPENCLGALEYCKEKGCDFVFFDVSLTKDNVGVLFRDEDLVRMAGINKKLKLLTWGQVKNVDVSTLHNHKDKFKGQKTIPSLESALDTCIDLNLKFFINVVDSSDEMIEVVCNAYKTRKALYSMAAVTSFHWKVIYEIRKRDPKIIGCLAFPLSQESKFGKLNLLSKAGNHLLQSSGVSFIEWWHQCYDNFLDWFLENFLWWYLGLTAIFIHKDGISKNEIRDWGLRGIRVFLWMVDNKEEKSYVNKALKVGYLTDTIENDPVLISRNANKGSSPKGKNKKGPNVSLAETAPLEDYLTSDDSLHSIVPSPQESQIPNAYLQQMLNRAAAKLH